jgi:hypothetical protein
MPFAAGSSDKPEATRPFTLQTTNEAAPTQHANAGRSAAVTLNLGELLGERIVIELPGGIAYEAVREVQQNVGEGRQSWVGHAEGDPDSAVVLGISGDAVAGTFVHQGHLFKLEPRASGPHLISAVSAIEPAPELDPVPIEDVTSTTSASGANNSNAAGGSGPVVDVLVAYTPAVRAQFGTQGTEALIVLAVAEANQAYANSGMSMRLNLVGSLFTNYLEAQDIYTDLTRLSATRDGYMDEIHTVRDNVGADVVSLIADRPGECGLAYRMSTLSVSFATNAFSIVHHACATGYYSFAHEIGHNLGAHHDYANANGTPLFPYAYGYQEPGNAFRTIMAMNCPGGCPRVAQFSRSSVQYDGKPTGTPYFTENAYTIDQTAPTVAGFRERSSLPPGC